MLNQTIKNAIKENNEGMIQIRRNDVTGKPNQKRGGNYAGY